MIHRLLIISHLAYLQCRDFTLTKSIVLHANQFHKVASSITFSISTDNLFFYLDLQNEIFPLAARDSMPDLLITVNFTTLQIPINNMINMFDNSIQIMIGLTNDTNTVVERTQATTLIPGVNLISTISWGFRQVFKTPGLSAFGLFEVSLVHFYFYHC